MKKLSIVLAAFVLVLSFSFSAMAADWSFYGDARFDTYFYSDSKAPMDTTKMVFDPTYDKNASGDDEGLQWDQSNILSRVGMKVKAGDVSGHIELRPQGGSHVRHWYGKWDFGPGEFLVGKTWPVCAEFTNRSNYGDYAMGHWGNLGYKMARVEQMRFSFYDLAEMVDLKLGLISPQTSTVSGTPTTADTDTITPNIEGRADVKINELIKLSFNLGYGMFRIEDETDVNNKLDENISSYFVGAAIYSKFDFGMYINFEFHYGSNMENYGLATVVDQAANFDAENKVKNNTGYGGLLVLGYKINDTYTLEFGVSTLSGEDDVDEAKEEKASMMYITLPIKVADGVMIQPEIGRQMIEDYVASATAGEFDDGERTYFGFTTKISF